MADSTANQEAGGANTDLVVEPASAKRISITSAWVPLRRELFRVLWLASVASNLGTWMHEVGASWLMTQLAPSPLMVSLVQTSEASAVWILVLAAGALADVLDRRRLLLFSQSWMLGAAGGLGILTILHLTTPGLLLAFTFLLSFGNALNGPAWQAIVPELVSRTEMPAAVSLNSVGFNVARAVGPAVGGLIVAAVGSGAVFLLNAVSFLGVIVVLYRWHRSPRESVLPAERVAGAIRAGLRYVWHAPSIQCALVRVAAFMLGASALWALVPLYARQNLGLGAAAYGALLAFFGTGAVIGGSFLPYLQKRLGIERLLSAGMIVFATALALMAVWRQFAVAATAMFSAGFAWTTQLSTLNTSVQLNAPAWVRGRALAVHQFTYFATLGICSAFWGSVALHFGVPRAIFAAGAALAIGLAAARRFPVVFGDDVDFEPAPLPPVPMAVNEPHPEDGPVLVTVEYRINPLDAGNFTPAMRELRRIRRRDGAMRWGLFEDVAKPGRYVETFVVESWAEYLRQQDRSIIADHRVRERVRAFHMGDLPPVVSHLVYAYSDEQ
jgi:MFS family permease